MLADLDPLHLQRPWGPIAIAVAAFVAAAIVSRLSARVAGLIVRRFDARHADLDGASSGVIASIKRRETTISLVRTSVRYVAFAIALVVAIGALSGATRTTTVAWASIAAVLIGFAFQRLLTDIISGLLMVFDGWFSVGDTIVVEPLNLHGVVEEISLRAVRMRALNGQTLRVHNSQIYAVRVSPRGVVGIRLEVFVRDEALGRALIDDLRRLVPTGATDFVRPPTVESVQRLAEDLYLFRVRASVVTGREWLAHDYLPQVLKEQAPEGLVIHGPVVLEVDDVATRRFARAVSSATSDVAAEAELDRLADEAARHGEAEETEVEG